MKGERGEGQAFVLFTLYINYTASDACPPPPLPPSSAKNSIIIYVKPRDTMHNAYMALSFA